MITPHDAYVGLVLKVEDVPTLREIRLQALIDERMTIAQRAEIVERINRKIDRAGGGIHVLETDEDRCPNCRLPWKLHPRLDGLDEPYCRSFPLEEAVR